MDIIIIPGHYQEKSSFNADKPNIVRILGPNIQREGYWLTQDGKSLSDYEISENYVLLDTRQSENDKGRKLPPKSIFAGIEETPSDMELDFSEVQVQTSNFPPPEQSHQVHIIPNTYATNQQPQQPKDIPIQPSFDITIIDKINIDVLNQKNIDKYGIEKYRKPVITVNLPIELDYDISKLKQTIELLDLDENVIIDYIISKIPMTNIKQALKDKISNHINNLEQPNHIVGFPKFQPAPVKLAEKELIPEVPQSHPTEIPVIKSETIQELEAGISEVENYLKGMF